MRSIKVQDMGILSTVPALVLALGLGYAPATAGQRVDRPSDSRAAARSATAAPGKSLAAVCVEADRLLLDHTYTSGGFAPLRDYNGTWAVKDGVLVGQAPAVPHEHKGSSPKLLWDAKNDYVMELTFKLEGAALKGTKVHVDRHNVILLLDSAPAVLKGERDSTRSTPLAGFKFETGRWYRMRLELAKDIAAVRVADGPALFLKDAAFLTSAKTGRVFTLDGPEGGTVFVDDIKVWSVKAGTAALCD